MNLGLFEVEGARHHRKGLLSVFLEYILRDRPRLAGYHHNWNVRRHYN